ncbi:hypothetical protein EJB05_55166 [Eragrostis curvula]|uniref:U3 small nucleolar ribonucleoprotein protein MPP10 n=1 Tax=Eragrostis curvula TaxID=38414 RepID=A0A5J9SKI9_9POAL|nr:hypothetical protein EJB05_55166 [Eragrostis curvula]
MAMDMDEPLDASAAAEKGEAALRRLRDADLALFLSPSADLAAAARAASQHVYSSLAPLSPAQPPPLPSLLAGPAFDAEQIWSQIELLTRPLLPHLHRQLRRLEQQPPSQPKPAPRVETPAGADEEQSEEGEEGSESEELEDEEEELEGTDDEDEMEEDDDEDEEELDGKGGNGVEDKFLKRKDLEEFLEQAEEEEYGGGAKQGKEKKAVENWMEEDSDDEDMDEDEDEDEEDEEDDEDLTLEDFEDDDEEDEGKTGGDIMYKDFFEKGHKQVKKRDSSTKRVQFKDEAQEIELDDSEDDDRDEQDEQVLSTHEKERLKKHAEIEQMEKAILEPNTWTMQGEVTASKRPKNSALEVDLDFEHNVRPAPVITEEITASLEDMIKKRIAEGHFDDVEKPSLLPTKAPKERKELDESKSKKGLAELYEEDYAQQTGLAPAPLSISDELKKEANTLFKKICLKLDALSHFHFAPKPVIEDMSIQANVPALAMEEIAPIAVSDAAMLAPEEIFDGKGDVKEEAELTQAERKRRRANKKRRYAESHKERPAKLQKEA